MEFSAELWEWRGPAPFYWLTVPAHHCAAIRAEAAQASYGWGAIPVSVRIGATEWETSLLPKDGGYVLPVKSAVRARERVGEGDAVTVALSVAPRGGRPADPGPSDEAREFDGLVLAGGRGRRLGGPGKPALDVGGRRMIDVVRGALEGARALTVVGPGGDLVEQPPGGGPVAAIAAGLARVTAPVVVVLAADLPFVTAETVRRLVAAAPATAVDDEGRAQYLLGAYPTSALRAALPADPRGARVGDVVRSLAPQGVRFDERPPPWWDCDTAEQLEQARRWA